jgi:hypothetical protein
VPRQARFFARVKPQSRKRTYGNPRTFQNFFWRFSGVFGRIDECLCAHALKSAQTHGVGWRA